WAGGTPMVKSVLVYRNGDPFFPGRRIVINEKKVSNFEVFLKEVTGGVKAPFGAVRNIYTPRGGHRIRQLEELQSGEHYVAGGREAFKKLNLIANGDLVSPVVRLFIPRKALNQWDHILEMVTEKVTLRSGAVHRLYTLDGKLVQNGSDLENGQFYVAVGRDKFKKLPYGDVLFSKSTIRRKPSQPRGSLMRPHSKVKGLLYCQQILDVFSLAPLYHIVSQFDFTSYHSASFPIVDEGIYKAGEKRSEMWGAAEVQEDEDTRVEVPLDQVMIDGVRAIQEISGVFWRRQFFDVGTRVDD
uniref:Doublecortin domain-containing protein 2 n=1 Tax=Apteryx owenii TaxID=8824 RepID=A0A8B9QLB2_APTOW